MSDASSAEIGSLQSNIKPVIQPQPQSHETPLSLKSTQLIDGLIVLSQITDQSNYRGDLINLWRSTFAAFENIKVVNMPGEIHRRTKFGKDSEVKSSGFSDFEVKNNFFTAMESIIWNRSNFTGTVKLENGEVLDYNRVKHNLMRQTSAKEVNLQLINQYGKTSLSLQYNTFTISQDGQHVMEITKEKDGVKVVVPLETQTGNRLIVYRNSKDKRIFGKLLYTLLWSDAPMVKVGSGQFVS